MFVLGVSFGVLAGYIFAFDPTLFLALQCLSCNINMSVLDCFWLSGEDCVNLIIPGN